MADPVLVCQWQQKATLINAALLIDFLMFEKRTSNASD